MRVKSFYIRFFDISSSFFDDRYLQSAMYFKTIEGFLEAGPQMTLQLSLLFRGNATQSSRLVLSPIFSPEDTNDAQVEDLEVLGRLYDEGNYSRVTNYSPIGL